jgi:drug/metabolite transporter (DMT)-like permease
MKKVTAPLGASLVVLSSVFYASYGIWTKLMGSFFGGYTASCLRSILVLIILLPIIWKLGQFEPLRLKKNWPYIAGMTGFSLLVWGPFYYAILTAGVGLALTVNYACIVIGMFFFGWLLAGERLTKDKMFSALLGLLGLALIFLPGTSRVVWLALGAAILSGSSMAGVSVLQKMMPYNAAQTTAMAWVTSVIANAIMLVIFREALPSIGWHVQWLYLVLFAAASLVASWSLTRGIKLIEAGAAGILGLLEIVFGVLFGIIFFSEKPSALVLCGVALIIAASAIPYVKDFNLKRGTL